MTVSELIELLKTQPQDLTVVYSLFSEYCELEAKDIEVCELQPRRNDGWVHRRRNDKPREKYLCFPGN